MGKYYSNDCKYFNGILNDACRAGVCYESVRASMPIEGCGIPIPCMIMASLPGAAYDPCKHFPGRLAACPKLELYTREEQDQNRVRLASMMAAFAKLQPMLSKIKREHKGKSWRGNLECPLCHGILYVSHAGVNGHCHVKCATDGCINMME